MSLENLKKLSPGLNDDTDTQTAETIINIDTGDADENGLPIDTSSVPEADVAEAQEETAAAVEAQGTAEDTAAATEDLDKVEEALESLQRERRGPTAMEAKLIDQLADGATSTLYAAASRGDRLAAVYGSGLNSIDGATDDLVAAGLNEVRKGVMDTLKEFIRKVVEFFKSIGKAIGKWLSGSKKLLGRADEIIKRANEAKTASKQGKVSLGKSGALAYGMAATAAGVNSGIANLIKVSTSVLKEGKLYGRASVRVVELLGKDLDENAKSAFDTIAKDAESAFSQFGTGSRSSMTLIGGLQFGVIAKAEEYKITAFTKQTDVKETSDWPILSKTDAASLAGSAKELIQIAMGYQDGWKERDRTRATWEREANKLGDTAKTDYAKGTDDKIIQRFKVKRRIAQAAGSTLMSVQSVENKFVGHNLRVASAALDYADKSVKELNKEEKKADK